MNITKTTATQKFMFSGLLLMMGTFALFMAFVVVPAIATASGIAEDYVTYTAAAVAFVVAIVATRWAKSLNAKKPAE